jgi:hypothetical protein
MSRLIASSLAVILFAAVRSASAAPTPADILTVGTDAGAPNASVDVPVYIRDTSGTPLGIDQPFGSRIQSYSIKIDYSPAASVQSVTFVRAGITAALTPTFENSPSSAGSVSLLDTFSEATNLIPFTSNAPLPGNQIGVLHFVIANSATPGTITLTVDTTLTQLTDEGGSPATKESTTNANLVLVDGAITITPATPVRLQLFEVR